MSLALERAAARAAVIQPPSLHSSLLSATSYGSKSYTVPCIDQLLARLFRVGVVRNLPATAVCVLKARPDDERVADCALVDATAHLRRDLGVHDSPDVERLDVALLQNVARLTP